MRLVTAALLLLSVTTQSALADNEVQIPDEILKVADEAQVNPVDLAGAVNTTGKSPREYLQFTGELPAPAIVATGYLAHVRLTYYLTSGVTYSGKQTYAGSTACSWNFPLGTRFRFADGETVTCIDRGMLGNGKPYGWLDVYRNKPLVDKYGAYADVHVLP